MSDERRSADPGEHTDHAPRLARLEERLATGLEPDDDLRTSLASCTACGREGDELTKAALRIRQASASLAFDRGPSAAVRARVRHAALGGLAQPDQAPASVDRVRRMPAGLFGRFAWAGAGAAAGALALAVALTLGNPTPTAVAAFTMTGSDLAPGASGVAELRPLSNGSVAMTLEMRGLPRSKPGEFYELWWVGPDKRHVSCGTFRSDGSPVDLSFTSGVDISTTVLIEVTLELDDGDAAPGPHVAQ